MPVTFLSLPAIGIAQPKPAAKFTIIKASIIYSSALNLYLSLVRPYDEDPLVRFVGVPQLSFDPAGLNARRETDKRSQADSYRIQALLRIRRHLERSLKLLTGILIAVCAIRLYEFLVRSQIVYYLLLLGLCLSVSRQELISCNPRLSADCS